MDRRPVAGTAQSDSVSPLAVKLVQLRGELEEFADRLGRLNTKLGEDIRVIHQHVIFKTNRQSPLRALSRPVARNTIPAQSA